MKTVLIIDDDDAFRKAMGEFLAAHEWRVLEAGDGEAGLRLAREHRPAAILCDLLMPRTNGFLVCSAIRGDSALRHSLLVAVSGRGYPTTRQSAYEAGADEFLLKPVHPEALLELLTRMTGPERSAAPRWSAAPDRQAYLRFWGVRGSIPSPGPATAYYGGNTSCVELRADGELIILDAGTGIRALGQSLKKEFQDQPLHITILITHTHWDHVHGFPFFAPAYDQKNHIRILGFEGARESLAGIFSGQMESPYFPIGLSELPGHVVIEELKDMTFAVGGVEVRAAFVNHPGICVGYRLKTSRGSVAYLPDNEPFYRLRSEPESQLFFKEAAAEYARGEDQKMIDFIKDVDVLIIDSQYDMDEYKAHRGWGHGCVDDVVTLATRAGVRRLYLFHHDPNHDDEKVAQMRDHARKLAVSQGSPVVIEAAREGDMFDWGRRV